MDDPGAAALMLVSTLIADLQAKGLISSAELATAVAAFAELPIPPDQRRAADHALAVLEGMTQRMGGP